MAVLLLAPVAHAETADQPLFEAGVFAVGGWFPDYPASSQNHVHALPLPYIIYRGQYLQMNETSARGIFYAAPAVSFDVSASGAFRSSHDDDARRGMPGLDYMGQVGPRMNLLLARDAMYAKIDLEIPVRAVFSTDLSSIAFRGVLLAPEIAYTHTNFMDTGGRLKIGIGPEFATARLMQYFYSVQQQFVIPGRPQFNATGGYLGTRLSASYRVPLNERMSVIALVAPELYKGATNSGSPLFKKEYGISAGLALSFSFYRSEAVARGELE
jgi:outer membrane protein